MWKLSLAMLVACTGGGRSPSTVDAVVEEPGVDAGTVDCNGDGFEPNNTTAFPTPVGESLDQMSLRSELCPSGDVELFSLVIGPGQVFEASLTRTTARRSTSCSSPSPDR